MKITGIQEDRFDEILTNEALAFVADLHRRFDERRRALLEARSDRLRKIQAGERPGFLAETADVRNDPTWQVAPAAPGLVDRRVEITGPVERKMMINAFNSGAKVFMADFEDSATPSWTTMVNGHINVMDAIRGTISFENPDGRRYELANEIATIVIRPRGWHLVESHMTVDNDPVSASLFDFGLYFFHNAEELIARGIGPYFYLPKLESHLEARLWNDVFNHAQLALDIPHGTIRATVLIETILAAFEMEEILYELRDHSSGLNAGRWDYIFSVIKKFRNRADMVLPDRGQITMTVPFMRAYTELMVKTCHSRGAHAIGGMAAFIPSRRDEEVNKRAFSQVTADKERESADGCDGTWVAHPDLVALVKGIFDGVLGDRPHQIERQRPEVSVTADDLLDTTVDGGTITTSGIHTNVGVAIEYLASWLRGNGAAGLNNLMEDAATAEISRSQIWQWVHNGAVTDDNQVVTTEMIQTVADEEMERIRSEVGDFFDDGMYQSARRLFEDVALADKFPEFLTLPGYQLLLQQEQRDAQEAS